MQGIGLQACRRPPPSLDEAMAVVERIGLPVVIRPAFILGGKGTGIAATRDDFARLAATGLAASPIHEILIERSIAGWKEYELEVMRDRRQLRGRLLDREPRPHGRPHRRLDHRRPGPDPHRRRVPGHAGRRLRLHPPGGGGDRRLQRAVRPRPGQRRHGHHRDEPRVSRSSALASKATGFPIAKIAAKLAVGYTLDEIPNDITAKTPASFEPTIDYVVTKVPRWAFEKFPGSAGVLGTSMQSVGEAMAIGRTFPESLQKALRSLEHGRRLNCDRRGRPRRPGRRRAGRPGPRHPDRPFQEAVLRRGITVDDLAAAHPGRPRFLDQMLRVVEEREHLAGSAWPPWAGGWKRAKQLGFSDAQLCYLWDAPRPRCGRPGGWGPAHVQDRGHQAEFEASTPYHYSTYEDEDEVTPSGRRKVLILGSGPNRIGQGIEFDYCCVHASFALADAGYETVMLNCNPETVSTDYDTSDRLYFEPLTLEDALNVIEAESRAGGAGGRGRALGGQTPLAGGGAARGPRAGHVAGLHRPGRGPRAVELPVRPPGDPASWPAAPPPWTRPWPSSTASATRPCCGPATCWAAGPWRSSTTPRACAGPWPSWPLRVARPGGRAVRHPAGAGRPVPGGRHRGRRGRPAGPHRRGGHRGGHGARGGGRGPLRRLGLLDPAPLPVARDRGRDRGLHPAWPTPSTYGASSTSSTRSGRARCSSSRPTPGQPHGPVRGQGHRRPAGEGGAPGDGGRHPGRAAGEGLLREPVGGHIAVKEAVLPFNRFPTRHGARAGDALHRRGHGHRPHLRSRLRQGPDLGRRPPARHRHGVRVAGRPGQAGGVKAAARFVELGFAVAATDGTADHLERHGVPVAQRVAKVMSEDDAPAPAARRPPHRRRLHRRRAGGPGGQQPRGGVPGPTAPTSAGRPTSTGSRASPPRPPHWRLPSRARRPGAPRPAGADLQEYHRP